MCIRRIKLSTSLLGLSCLVFLFHFLPDFCSPFAQLSLSVHNPLRSSDSHAILVLLHTCRLSNVWTVIVMLVESFHALFSYG